MWLQQPTRMTMNELHILEMRIRHIYKISNPYPYRVTKWPFKMTNWCFLPNYQMDNGYFNCHPRVTNWHFPQSDLLTLFKNTILILTKYYIELKITFQSIVNTIHCVYTETIETKGLQRSDFKQNPCDGKNLVRPEIDVEKMKGWYSKRTRTHI